MVFEKSTATSGVSARVCIKRKSRSCPPPLHPTRLLRHRPIYFFSFPTFSPVFPFETSFPPITAAAAPVAVRVSRSALSILRQLFFTSFFPVLSFLGYVPRRTNFERPYNACTPCVVRRNVGSPPQILLFPWHEVLRANLYGKQYVDGIESTIRRNGAWNSVLCYLKLYPWYPCIMTSKCFSMSRSVDDFLCQLFQSFNSIFMLKEK